MSICCLCNKRDADKLGSHVVPAFMLVSLIGKRNKEIGFQISSQGFIDKFIGREVSQEKISEVLNRELTEEDTKSNDNLFTVNNLLCTYCETRLGILESLSSNEIINIKNGKKKLINSIEIVSLEQGKNLIIRTLFYTILLRITATEKFNYNLNHSLKEKLRLLLDKTLSDNQNELNKNLTRFKSEIISIPFALFFAPISSEDGGNQIYSHKPLSIPSFIIVNEFIVVVYNTKAQVEFDFGSVYSISKTNVLDILNFNETSIKVGCISTRKNINESLTRSLVVQMQQNLGKMFLEIYKIDRGRSPSNNEVNAFMNDLINDETPMADKYNPQFLAKKIHSHLNK